MMDILIILDFWPVSARMEMFTNMLEHEQQVRPSVGYSKQNNVINTI